MDNLIACKQCGSTIEAGSTFCPKCGAAQSATIQVNTAAVGGDMAPKYATTPWFRRRWFLILCLLTIAPIAGVISLTGPMFFDAKGTPKTFAPNVKSGILVVSAYYIYTLFTPVGSSQQLICFLIAALIAIYMGTRK